jgi:hypothetical protein
MVDNYKTYTPDALIKSFAMSIIEEWKIKSSRESVIAKETSDTLDKRETLNNKRLDAIKKRL